VSNILLNGNYHCLLSFYQNEKSRICLGDKLLRKEMSDVGIMKLAMMIKVEFANITCL